MSENWHKRHAMVLAGQLPENAPDANAVNRELQHLVDNWLYPADRGHGAPVPFLFRQSDGPSSHARTEAACAVLSRADCERIRVECPLLTQAESVVRLISRAALAT